MVGVAGRSKGCKTCRERKIKCDEARPGCVRCQKIGKECPGYARTLHFVYSTQQKASPITWEETATTTIESNQLQVVVANSVQRRPKAGSRARQRGAASGNSDAAVSGASSTPAVTQRTPLNISIPFDKSQVYVNVYVQDFIHVSAPYRTVGKTAMVPYRFGHLYATHFRTGDTPEMRKELEDAFSACATTYFALKERDVSSKIQGHILYLKLLKQLKNYVKNGLANSDPAVFLYTCMMAAHYEILTSSSASTWLYHLAALGRLILSLGPYAFHDPLAGAILEVVRPYIVFNGLMELKRTFLEQDEWINIPPQYYPGGKSAWNRLIDLSTPFPRILEEGYALSKELTPAAAAVHLQTCLVAVNKLLAWRQEWNQTYGVEPYTYAVPSTSVPRLSAFDLDGPLFDTILYFDNISVCTTLYQYDMFILIMANHLRRFIPWFELYFGPTADLTMRLRRAAGMFEVELTCREIARCVDYQRAPQFRFGSTGLFFGAKVAYDIVDRNSRLGRYLERAILNSPVMQRTGVTGAGDLLKGWYGPDPPTEADILRVRLQLQQLHEQQQQQQRQAQERQQREQRLETEVSEEGYASEEFASEGYGSEGHASEGQVPAPVELGYDSRYQAGYDSTRFINVVYTA
ncbi:hypothetical protein TWF696_001283 [Orbilia brochopaga]|uniref:Zn(2)-C6 fungal-type domain-containing protein n=1 Tax=Orbilia brochopaga TaxID=3140254 RepID=A0AAV9UCM3_9PEZI